MAACTMVRTLQILFLFTHFLCIFCEPPAGHMKPIGGHRKPIGGVTVLEDFPLPTDFYENYLAKSRPFVVKGVLEKGQFPAYNLWTDKYLNDKYGSVSVDVEGGKKEDRGASQYVMPMSKFLQIYNQSSIYMVYDVAKEMKDDITVPVSIQCGGLQDAIRSVITWFSSGGTKSVLHNDGLDNFNCLLDGKKDLVMYHKKYRDEIEADHWVTNGAYSRVDVEAVDMEKFPKLADLDWYLVNITKGDCLYIPYHWYHHVNSHSGRNLAINVWSHHVRWFNKTDCDGVEDKLKPKSLKYFESKGLEQEERESLFAYIFEEMEYVTRTEFITRMREFVAEDVDDELIMMIFDLVDTDKDDVLQVQEMETIDHDKLSEEIPDLDSMFTMDAVEPTEEEQTAGYPQHEGPTVINMDDDVSYLLTSSKQVDDKLEISKKEEL